tara:strand:- start:880 stop:1305 length:426 start_codon:yes stop_codon:yes gene_type:complete
VIESLNKGCVLVCKCVLSVYNKDIETNNKNKEDKMRTVEAITADLNKAALKFKSYKNGMLEGGEGFNPHEEALATLDKEYDQALFARDWSLEKTIQNRKKWNDLVVLKKYEILELMERAGFSKYELRSALEHHNLIPKKQA